MRKKIFCLLLVAGLCCSVPMTAQAETLYGDADWSVAFTAQEKMESNFKTADVDDVVSGLQPGDNVVIRITLKNDSDSLTDWYMTNEILYSLEDRSANAATGGGAYTYILSYMDENGEAAELFSSDTVGGETAGQSGEGLHEATDALEDYFYLDSLDAGQKGTIALEIALDGETQGNDYQGTLADLQMNFAVELNQGSAPENPHIVNNSIQKESFAGSDSFGKGGTKVVKTGDETNMLPYILAAAVSGCAFLMLSIYSWKEGRKQRKGAE